MEALWNEVQNLKATMKQWEIVTLNKSGSSYPFDNKYANWNWIVLKGSMYYSGYNAPFYERNYNSATFYTNTGNKTLSFSKSGNSITTSGDRQGDTLTVLFYK